MTRTLVQVVLDYKCKYDFQLPAKLHDVLEVVEKSKSCEVEVCLKKLGEKTNEWLLCRNQDDFVGYVKLDNVGLLKDFYYKQELLKYLTHKAIQMRRKLHQETVARKNEETLQKLLMEIASLLETEGLGGQFAEHIIAILEQSDCLYGYKASALLVFEWFAANYPELRAFAEVNIEHFSSFLENLLIYEIDKLYPSAFCEEVVNLFNRWCSFFSAEVDFSGIPSLISHYAEKKQRMEMRKLIENAEMVDWSQSSEGPDDDLKTFESMMSSVSLKSEAADCLNQRLLELLNHKDSFEYKNLTSFQSAFKSMGQGDSSSRMEASETSSSCENSLKLENDESADDGRDEPCNSDQPLSSKATKMRKCTPRQLKNQSLDDILLGQRLSFNARELFKCMTQYTKVYTEDQIAKLGVLGEGGQAAAYLVTVHDNITPMVFKKFDQLQQRFIEFILKEFTKLIQSWNHPNIVPLYGLVVTNCQEQVPVGLLIEYLDSNSLKHTIYDFTFEYGEIEVLEWSLQAASALLHLHSKGLIHRDIKPENFLMMNKEVLGMKRRILKLADFGMVKRCEAAMSDAPKSHFGTKEYRAPEGNPNLKASYSTSLDIYSFGLTIWEMAERRSPFANYVTVMSKNGYVRRPSLDNPKYKWLPGLVEKMWAEDPLDRPQITAVYSNLAIVYNDCLMAHGHSQNFQDSPQPNGSA